MVVVGSGLAGLSAASEIISHDVPVQLLERAAKPGGNSIKASSGINGVPTKWQPLPDSVDAFQSDTEKSAGASLANAATTQEKGTREKLIDTLVTHSAGAIDWLVNDRGIDLSLVAQLGGHSKPRTHRGGPGQKPPGFSIVSTLLEHLKKSPLFKIQTNSRVTKLLRENERVIGVEYVSSGDEDSSGVQKMLGPVVFASGGFGGDAHGLLAKYRPDLAGYPTTNDEREGSQPLLQDVGASVVDMDSVQVHPTGFVDPKDPNAMTKILAGELLRGEGGILLSGDGKRFSNELDRRDKISEAILKTALPKDTSTKQWGVTILLDERTAKATASHLGFYKWKGLMRETTIKELGLPGALDTVREYADIVAGHRADSLGREVFGKWELESEEVSEDTTVVVGQVAPVVHFTMGGVAINEESQVLDSSRQQIDGLWAAGEISGGLHGDNRLGGSSLLECVVFGRIAGKQAAEYHHGHDNNHGNH